MRRKLTLHPDSCCLAAAGIDVDATRPRPGLLELRYILAGNIAGLRLPPATAPARADELWRHTCFEAFLQTAPGAGYYEFNLAPSTHWAAYRFDCYRSGMTAVQDIAAPRIETGRSAGRFELRASLRLDGLPGLDDRESWRLGLSAVIEESDGGISYWALAHPAGRADFHHSDCFDLDLPAA